MRKGSHHSEESRRRLSEANKGEKNPNYGKPRSLETRRKISEANKGKTHSLESRRKMSLLAKERFKDPRNHPMYGKYHSEEAKKKISRKGEMHYNYGKHPPVETRKKMSEAQKGRVFSVESRRKMSKVRKGRFTGKHNSFYGKCHTEESKQKISNALMGKYTGKNHWNWQGGIGFETYDYVFNEDLKRQIHMRDNFTCQLCGTNHDLVVHHIDYDKKNSRPENLITLCRSGNGKVNINRNYWTAFFSSLLDVCGLKDY